MANAKLYLGDVLIGGDVSADDIDGINTEIGQITDDVAGKFDKGDPTGVLDGDAMDYDTAVLMEVAVKGNASAVNELSSSVDDLLEQLTNSGGEISVELGNMFPKLADDDPTDGTLAYQSALTLGDAVVANATAINDLDAKVDANDAKAVKNANDDGAGVAQVLVIDALPDTPDVNTLYVVTG